MIQEARRLYADGKRYAAHLLLWRYNKEWSYSYRHSMLTDYVR